MGLAERLRASEARVKELAEKRTHDMKEAEQRIKELDADYRRVIREVLACDPRPAKDRADDQLEPPWEVVARVRRERDEAREQLTRALHDLDIANGEIARAAGGGGDE